MDRSTRRVLVGMGAGLPLVALGAARRWSHPGTTPPIHDARGRLERRGIATLEPIRLAGEERWLLVRGRSVHQPLLLFLSGGPGSAELAWMRHFNASLEEHFLVAAWEPGGGARAGEEPRMESLLAEADELLELLTSRFSQEKVFLVGHGWGSVLGVLLAQRRPERIHAYVSTGQRVNFLESDTVSHLRAYERAMRHGDAATLAKLARMGPPPYIGRDRVRRYQTLERLAGLHAGRGALLPDPRALALRTPEYSLRDKLHLALAGRSPTASPRLMDLNLERQVPRLDVPVWFLLGREDAVTPSELAVRYFDALEAPAKTLLWFEHSGHQPAFEEPEHFNSLLIERVRAEGTALPPDIVLH